MFCPRSKLIRVSPGPTHNDLIFFCVCVPTLTTLNSVFRLLHVNNLRQSLSFYSTENVFKDLGSRKTWQLYSNDSLYNDKLQIFFYKKWLFIFTYFLNCYDFTRWNLLRVPPSHVVSHSPEMLWNKRLQLCGNTENENVWAVKFYERNIVISGSWSFVEDVKMNQACTNCTDTFQPASF